MTARVLSLSDTAHIIITDAAPNLAQWQRDLLIRLSRGAVSDECVARIEGVLRADELAWLERGT